jgi:hypothetical protein
MTPTPLGERGGHGIGRHEPAYVVRVQGRLDARWSAWFDGLDVVGDDDGTTTIRGAVHDQAALHGLLQKVRDVGLPILSVTRVAPGSEDEAQR